MALRSGCSRDVFNVFWFVKVRCWTFFSLHSLNMLHYFCDAFMFVVLTLLKVEGSVLRPVAGHVVVFWPREFMFTFIVDFCELAWLRINFLGEKTDIVELLRASLAKLRLFPAVLWGNVQLWIQLQHPDQVFLIGCLAEVLDRDVLWLIFSVSVRSGMKRKGWAPDLDVSTLACTRCQPINRAKKS